MWMAAIDVLFDFVKGNHTLGQILNLSKYFLNDKKPIANWDPIYISSFLTYNCNLNCDMCLTHSTKFDNPYGQKPCKEMSFELFRQILHRYKNAIKVNLIGNGDPLLHKDFFEMVEYAATVMKMDTISSSNGVLVGKYADKIINSPLKQFIISLNGHTSEEFNRMTGMSPKLFPVICNNTVKLVNQKKLMESKLEIIASIILDKLNYRYLKDMIYFVDSLGVDKIAFFHFLPTNANGFTAEERCLFSDDPEVLEVFSKINSMPSRIKQKVMLPPLLERVMGRNKYCTTWFYNISVDGDGNVGGCSCQLLDLTVSGKFVDENCWNNQYFQEMRNRFIDPEIPLLEPCTRCYNNSRFVCDWVSVPNPFLRIMKRLSHGLQK